MVLVVAAGSSLVALALAPGSMVLVAMTVFTVALVLRHHTGTRRA